MSDDVTLDDLRAAYRRAASRIYRILEDGYDFSSEHLIIDALDRDALILDAAFFVLIVGQIENRINELSVRRLGTDEKRRDALRGQPFERRLEMALPGAANEALRIEIDEWYGQRSDVARGERLTFPYNIATVFGRAFQLEALVNAQPDRAIGQEESGE